MRRKLTAASPTYRREARIWFSNTMCHYQPNSCCYSRPKAGHDGIAMSLGAKVWTFVSSSMRSEPHSITTYWANPLAMPIVVPSRSCVCLLGRPRYSTIFIAVLVSPASVTVSWRCSVMRERSVSTHVFFGSNMEAQLSQNFAIKSDPPTAK